MIKEEIAVEGLVTTFGGDANSVPAAADAEVVRRLRAAGAVIVATTDDAGVRRVPLHRVRLPRAHPQPLGHRRTPGGSSGGTAAAVASGMVPVGIGGDGGGSIRIPSACCGLFGLKPQRGRVTSAPHEHLWFALGTAGPLTRSVLDSALVYDVIRGSARRRPLHGRRDRVVRRGRAARARAAADRLVDEGRRRSASARTRSMSCGRGHRRAARRARSRRREVDPQYPDPTAAFVPQFFAGIRAEADAMDHYERLERRTRETYRLGSWVTPRVIEWALAQTEKVAPRPTGCSPTSTSC